MNNYLKNVIRMLIAFLCLWNFYSCDPAINLYTLPLPVNSLTAEVESRSVILNWINPINQEELSGINITWHSDNQEEKSMSIPSLKKTATINDLTGEDKYIFAVKVVDSLGYESSPVEISVIPERESLRFYVDSTALPNQGGTSWETAFNSLEDALEAAYVEGDVIWVAEGTYKPVCWPTGGACRALIDNNRFRHFFLRPGVSLYGGFKGTETSLDQRQWKENPTILSGDFNGDDIDLDSNGYIDASSMSENALHVIYIPDTLELEESTLLDGFIISGGNANLPGHDCGGGVYLHSCSPSIQNCEITGNMAQNSGAGLYTNSSNVILDSVVFSNNQVSGQVGENGEWGGGGAFFFDSSAKLSSCVFYKNNSLSNGGGLGIYGNNKALSFTIIDCLIYKNTASYWGGGLNICNSITTIETSSIIGNTVNMEESKGSGVMIKGESSAAALTQCILWGNNYTSWRWWEITTTNTETPPVCTNCIIEDDFKEDERESYGYPDGPDGCFTGTGNTSEDPGFTDIENGIGADNQWFSDDDGIFHL